MEQTLTVSPAQRRAAVEALGLDPDRTLTVTLSSEWATALVAAEAPDGDLLMVDGMLVTEMRSGPIHAGGEVTE